MALTTQLRVLIEGDAGSLISQLNKAGRASTGVFTEVSRSAKQEFAAATREADKAFKEVARLQSMANRADKGGQSGVATALRSQAASKAAEAAQFSTVALAAEKKIQAEAAKTVAAHAAEASGVSKLGSAYAQQGGVISHFFGSISKEGGAATKTAGALKNTLSSFTAGGPTAAIATMGGEIGKLGKSAIAAQGGLAGVAGGLGGVAGPAAGVAAAVGAGAVAFGTLAAVTASGLKHFTEFAGEVRKVQNVVGGTAEDASLLAGQFRHFGIDVDSGTKALGIFGSNAANNGGKKLKDLGIHIAHTKDNQVDLTQTLLNAGDAFKKYGAGAEGAALVRGAFGRGGQAIIPLLKTERSELEAINRATSAQGLKFNDKDLKNAKDLTIATRELSHSFEGLQVSAAKGLAPLFTDFAEGSTDALNNLNKLTQKVGGLGGIVEHSVGGIGNALGSLAGAPFLGSAVDSLAKFGKDSSKAAKDQAILQTALDDSGEAATGFVADMLHAGDTIDEINVLIQQSGKSVEELGTAANISPEFDDLAVAIGNAGGAAALAGEQADSLHAKLDLLGQGAITLAGSQTNLAGAQAALADGLKESGNSFDNATAKGREHRQLIENDASAIFANIDALKRQGASVGEVSAAWDNQVGALKRTLSAAGLTDGQIQTLLNDYGLIPATKETLVNVQTADALKKLADLQYAVDHFHATAISVNIAGGLKSGSSPVGGGRSNVATGGRIAKGRDYNVAERGPELWLPALMPKQPVGTIEHLTKQAKSGADETLVRLGIPGGIEPRATRKGTPALLLGTQGPQTFTPPADGVVVNATDTKRLQRTEDPGIIERILKRAGADRKTLEALAAGPARAVGGPTTKDRQYQTGEKGPELFVPAQKASAIALTGHADKESRGALVRLALPGGIEPRATRQGSPALLLGQRGPQMFAPPTDGVIVKASDTQRLRRTDDSDIISRILKRAGADKATVEALGVAPSMGVAPARATGGPVQQGGEMPTFQFGAQKSTTPSIATPGVKRGSDGSYNITIGDTHLKVEAGTSGSAKGINKSDVDKIVERKQAELVQELVAAMRSG